MDKQKLKEIASVLSGLKRHEWSRVKIVVEKQYDSASGQLQLADTESLMRCFELEFTVVNQ